MADTLEKRVHEIEIMIAHLPNDLDVRFAGLQGTMGRRFDQLALALRTVDTRLEALAQAQSVIEVRLGNTERGLATNERVLAEINSKLDTLLRS